MTIYIWTGFSGEKIKTLLESSAVVSMGEIYRCQDISSYAISTYAISTAPNSTVHNFNRLQFQPFTLSTFCNFNLRQFQPIIFPPNCSQAVLIMKAFMVISKAIIRVQQLTIIFHTMKCDNYLQRFSSINSEVSCIVASPHNKLNNLES